MNAKDLVGRAEEWGTPAKLPRLRAAVAALVFLSFSTCLAKGANGPLDPTFADTATVPPFAQVGFKLIPPPGSEAAAAPTPAGVYCALLADALLARQRNLAGRGDLAGYTAMILDFEELTTQPYTPTGVALALTVSFYGADGSFLGVADTEACNTEAGCPPVAAPAPYQYVLLMPKGQLAALNGNLARLDVGHACPPPAPAPAPPA